MPERSAPFQPVLIELSGAFYVSETVHGPNHGPFSLDDAMRRFDEIMQSEQDGNGNGDA